MEADSGTNLSSLFDQIAESCVTALAEELEAHQGALGPQSPNTVESKAKIIFQDIQKNLVKRLNIGCESLVVQFVELSKQFPDRFNIASLNELRKINTKDQELYEFINKQAANELEQPIALRDFYGISEKAWKSYREVVEKLMTQDQFKEASDILYFLTSIDPYDSTNVTALGCAEYHLQNYEVAQYAFEVSQVLDTGNPQVFLYEAHCCEKLNDNNKAAELVEYALKVMGDDPQFEELARDAQEYLSLLVRTG